MSTVIVTAAFENGGEAGQIGIDVREWVDQRMSNAGLRAKMNNMRKAELFEQVRHPVAVGKVQFHEAKPTGFGKLRTPRLLQTWVIVGDSCCPGRRRRAHLARDVARRGIQ